MFLDPRLPERFWNKAIPEPNSGCWLWLAYTDKDGYGVARVNRRNYRAHRVSYSTLVAPIEPGLELDHLCRTTCCVNPLHMEPVCHRVNMLRGRGVGSANAANTHCQNGHEYTQANTYLRHVSPNGTKRECRACGRESTKRYIARKRKDSRP